MKLNPKPFVFAACSVPAALIVYDAFTDNLGVNPAQALVHRCGLWAFRFLLITLAVTPLRKTLRFNTIARYRRMFGLFCFFYAFMHLTAWAVFDQSLDFASMLHEVLKRPYIAIGMASFAMLIPLAATSYNAAIRWLGGQRWRRLHKLIYPVALLVPIHYLMLVKSWPAQPIIYAAISASLLLYRLVPSHKAATRK